MIYAGSYGIGSMAIQLVSLYGTQAISLANTTEKVEYCLDFGTDKVVNYKKRGFSKIFGFQFH